MKNRYIIGLMLFAGIIFLSCKKDKRLMDAEKIVNEWTGRIIQFPEDVQCKAMGKDTVCPDLMTGKQYKVLAYIDSLGCTNCKLKMPEWKRIIHEIDSIAPGQVGFLFYFHPKNEKELDFIMKRDRFDYPVFMDATDEINRLNHFPDNIMYQAFLLDGNNKVLLIGNPSLNPKIWKLYKQQITGKRSVPDVPLTTASVDREQLTLEGMAVGETTKVQFILTNTGDSPLIISDVKTSCGCTVPSWTKQPAKQGAGTAINVEIKPEESGYFRKAIDVYCNTKEGVIHLTVMGMVEK